MKEKLYIASQLLGKLGYKMKVEEKDKDGNPVVYSGTKGKLSVVAVTLENKALYLDCVIKKPITGKKKGFTATMILRKKFAKPSEALKIIKQLEKVS